MFDIKFVQSGSNFVQFSNIKKQIDIQSLAPKKPGQLSCFQKVWKILLLRRECKFSRNKNEENASLCHVAAVAVFCNR